MLFFTLNKICKKLHALSTPANFPNENPFPISIDLKIKTGKPV
jgi:hypothetical protein